LSDVLASPLFAADIAVRGAASATVMAPRPRRWARWARIAIAWCLIMLGLAGLVLPFLQGILLLLVGLALLAREQLWAARLLGRLKTRFPRLAAAAERAEARAKAFAAGLGRRRDDGKP
jgi:hypothetical protein